MCKNSNFYIPKFEKSAEPFYFSKDYLSENTMKKTTENQTLDKFGVKYSSDGTVLLNATGFLKKYRIRKGTFYETGYE